MAERVALVVGAGGPLGQSVVEKLVAAGYRVAGADRRKDGLETLPSEVVRIPGDATDPEAARRIVETAVSELGTPSVLVNTIGTYGMGDALSATPEQLRLMMDVNLGPALWLAQAAVPHMQAAGGGSIAFVSSRWGAEAEAGVAAYSLSKAALNHLVVVLNHELRGSGIRVNAVAPQLIDTPLNRSFLPADVLAHATAPDAIADQLVHLVTDAGAPVSGAILPAYGF
ncbi:NAD(P)-dependent dehydrogenase (short-subunit alcohol dehydrogenase family) [Catenulispora sp. GP43]|uniref:SDR family NAD(P)-dependent oxidoreductase n=1 Tax=Catenulispora sp. GP43 TaxID=3156263 RepID=UPI0035171B7E